MKEAANGDGLLLVGGAAHENRDVDRRDHRQPLGRGLCVLGAVC